MISLGGVVAASSNEFALVFGENATFPVVYVGALTERPLPLHSTAIQFIIALALTAPKAPSDEGRFPR